MNTSRLDAIVIGSGAGGAAAAYRLVRGGLRVLLVEKGDHLPADGSTLDVQRVVHAGEFLSREAWLDGRGGALVPEEHFNVGGKTKWYGAALLRFASHEFAADEAHGCRGWPIGLATLEPYYTEAEQLLGVRTFDCEPDLARILRRAAPHGGPWKAVPMPMALAPGILAERAEAMHFDGFASAQGLKADAERSLLSTLRGNDRFTLLTNAEAVTLLGRANSPVDIVGVQLRDGREYHAPRVLLAAGALHSPRLLARYVDAHDLVRQLPAARHIGRYLKLHLLTALVAASPRRMSDLIRKTMVLTNRRYPHSSVQPLGFDAELISSLVPRWVPRLISSEVGSRAYGFFLQTEDGSVPQNCVREDDIAGLSPPVLDYDASRLPAAHREHRAFTRAFQLALVRAGLIGLTRRIGLNGTAHACGTLACGNDPSDSVVDAQGRAHGLRGLYVVDGSVLPRSSRVNPSLTIYAWGLRVGDLIARQFAVETQAPRTAPELTHVA